MDLKQFYKEAFHLDDEQLLSQLAENSTYKSYCKGENLIQEGEIQETVPLLLSGICKGWFEDKNGKEVIDCLVYKLGEPAVGASRLTDPSPVSITTLTECEVVCIPAYIIDMLVNSYKEVLSLYASMLADSLEKHRKIKQMVYHTEADIRYQWFLEDYCDISNRLTKKTIACFLGMSPSWLSQIRSGKAKKDETKKKVAGKSKMFK